jgi:sialate O-acetylesterase
MQLGAIIEKGLVDWQIVQQVNGKAEISLEGSFYSQDQLHEPKVWVRIVKEDTGDLVLSWQASEDLGQDKWKITLRDVPTGGLYRIETCLNEGNSRVFEWAMRGDIIHHVGVGDIYVIAGQSNSAGYGKDPIYDPPELGVHLLKNSGNWDVASHPMNESTGTIHEVNRETANPGHSPYLSFAKQLKRELGYPIGLIQASLGGSPLSAWNPEENGVLYRSMINTINLQVGKVKGILWYQGCSDAAEGLCDTYLSRFNRMVSHLREDLKDENLPILTVQLNRLVTPSSEMTDRCWGKVREQQRQATKQINGVFIIPTTDCSLSDLIHNSSAANMIIGERLARAALNNIYGRNFISRAPDITSVKKLASDSILLTFDNVFNRLYAFEVGAEDLPFAVEDEKGFANIKSYELSNYNEITITLQRKLGERCKVHGVYEQNPKGVIPIDFVSHLPILSFYNVEVNK